MHQRTNYFLFVALVQISCLVVWATAASDEIEGILKSFPGFHVLTMADRDAETRTFIQERRPRNPSIIRADIDGDGHLDYALLLKHDKSKTAKLVVLLCSADHSCKKTYELDITGYSECAYMDPVPEGSRVSQTGGIDNSNSSPARLSATGIRVTYLGKGEVVFHWNKRLKKIVEVQTGD